jgi:hypothetical protein
LPASINVWATARLRAEHRVVGADPLHRLLALLGRDAESRQIGDWYGTVLSR